MNVKDLTPRSVPPEPAPGSALVVSYARGTVEATDWLRGVEADALTVAGLIQAVTNASEQQDAVAAQASLARYIRAVKTAEDAAKAPLNALRGKILALSKELQAGVDSEGKRIGTLVSEFQIAEQNRAAAARRLQDQQAHALELERDKKLLEATTLAEMDAIRDDANAALSAMAPPVEPVKVPGQVVREDWTVTVTDIWLLARAMPSCIKIEPRLSEIKSLLNAGVKVPGVLAEKVTKSSVRLGAQPEAINV
jgi:hypothetical protein